MKQLCILTIILVSLLTFSCMKDNDQPNGTGDAVIVVKKSQNEIVYGLSLYSYSFSPFKTVTAVNSATPEIPYTLTATNGSFSYETPEEEYSTTKPAPGTFTFTGTFENGVQQVFENTLYDKVISIPSFENCRYNAIEQRLEIEWRYNRMVTSYVVHLFDGSRLVYVSNELINTTVAGIPLAKAGWAQDYVPENGKTYKVRLFAYMFEPNGGSYNVQCVAMADTSAIWGN